MEDMGLEWVGELVGRETEWDEEKEEIGTISCDFG
jgi:hypothetical protein